MTSSFMGHCLCGAVQFASSTAPIRQANCHCDDCRRSSGSVYASFVFVPADALTIQGETASYEHLCDRGTTMTKLFCLTVVLSCSAPTAVIRSEWEFESA